MKSVLANKIVRMKYAKKCSILSLTPVVGTESAGIEVALRSIIQ